MIAPVLVKVRHCAGYYLATAGSGLMAARALSSTSGPNAAQKAAAKFYGTTHTESIQLQKHAPGVFRATQAEGGAS